MIRRLEKAVREWLGAEARGAGQDGALIHVFRSHAGPAPPADFTARVLARLAAELCWGRRPDIFAHRGLRAAVASALALVGVTLVFLPDLLRPLVRRAGAGEMGALGDLGGWIHGAANAFSAGAHWLAQGLEIWRILTAVGEALAAAAAQPAGVTALLASAFLAVAAFRALDSLITSASQRSA